MDKAPFWKSFWRTSFKAILFIHLYLILLPQIKHRLTLKNIILFYLFVVLWCSCDYNKALIYVSNRQFSLNQYLLLFYKDSLQIRMEIRRKLTVIIGQFFILLLNAIQSLLSSHNGLRQCGSYAQKFYDNVVNCNVPQYTTANS